MKQTQTTTTTRTTMISPVSLVIVGIAGLAAVALIGAVLLCLAIVGLVGAIGYAYLSRPRRPHYTITQPPKTSSSVEVIDLTKSPKRINPPQKTPKRAIAEWSERREQW